jgi:amino acid transporter
MSKKIPLFSLMLLIVASIDSIRNLPASALFGPPLIFFFIFSAIVFLIPVALISAELAASSPDKGGVYHWVSRAFGEKWGMVAIWIQWINTMIWYPSFLSFIAGTAAYLINPELAQDKTYLVGAILTIFWTMTFLNLFGLRVSAKINDVCASVGTMFPMLLLIVLGAVWYFSGQPLQIRIAPDTIFPSLDQSSNWVSLIAIMASFLGMELAGVHVSDIRDPQRNFPKAVLLSSAFILITMLFGSMAIAFVVPEAEINLVSGVMQVFTTFFTAFGLEWCIPVMTVLIVLGTLGGLINWLISPAKGLMQAAEIGFLPSYFAQKNQYGVAPRILIAQAVLVSLFCSVFLLVPSVNGFYWFLTALSTSMYMLMYILIFLSALILRIRNPGRVKTFRVPGRMPGLWTVVLLGLFACCATVTVSFLPPDNVDIGSPGRYTTMIGVGTISALLPLLFFFWYKKKSKSTH